MQCAVQAAEARAPAALWQGRRAAAVRQPRAGGRAARRALRLQQRPHRPGAGDGGRPRARAAAVPAVAARALAGGAAATASAGAADAIPTEIPLPMIF